MFGLIINPGAGPVSNENNNLENAKRNIQQFIKDADVKLRVQTEPTEMDDDGRFTFMLYSEELPDLVEVQMPGIPLEKVRYMGENNQNIFDFPRLYVNGSSWVWRYAIRLKDD